MDDEQDSRSNISSQVSEKVPDEILIQTHEDISDHYIRAETYRKMFLRMALKQFLAIVLRFMITMKERNALWMREQAAKKF